MAEEGKKKKREKTLQKKWERYTVEADSLTRKNKPCPKCGSGVFLAEHSDRRSCGHCGYMEKK
ncbi:MAG: 30S ribosomal protein S27ae [Candidatus Altiarchaeota archaeon]|nr:30S ribosomal protein S27ae [Candidatus Altiarchaeota archaeon]